MPVCTTKLYCIIPKYNDPFLYKEISKLGYEVLELTDQSKYYFNKNDYIELMVIDTGVNHDSTAICEINEKVFVNQNDCKIFDRLNYLENINNEIYTNQKYIQPSSHQYLIHISDPTRPYSKSRMQNKD